MARVAVIGGGVTGLAAAYHLARLTDAEIHLFEKDARLGGKIATTYVDGFLIEASADSIFTRRPGCMELIEELDLEDEVVMPQANEFGMLIDDRLWRIPSNLVQFGAITEEGLAAAEFLSDDGRSRAAGEKSVPPGVEDDESIASFFQRRYGKEFSQKVAEPLLAGTRSGLPEELSMKACYPSYFNMERKHGSLTAAMRSVVGKASGASPFVSFKGGIQALVDRLAERLGGTVVHHEPAHAIEPLESRYRVNEIDADAVLVAAPAPAASVVLGDVAPEASSLLRGIAASSGAIVTFGFRSEELASHLEGTGFLVPYTESSLITGAT